MTSATSSYFGIAKQTAKGTPNATYTYLPFITASGSPTNVIIPLDMEAGGGTPLTRALVKAGVSGAGAMEFIPRPDTLLNLLVGVLGQDSAVPTEVTVGDGAYKHTIKMNADKFDIPYNTIQIAPGNMWGEKFDDCRITALGLTWRAPGFLRGTLGFIGKGGSKVAAPASPTVDLTPPFVTSTPGLSIELPTASAVKVLSGSVTFANAIPLDEQWMVGAQSPDDFAVVSRAVAIQLAVKITDATLYSKMVYDPAGGSTWVADLFKEGDFKLSFETEGAVGTGSDHGAITVLGDKINDNVVWTADPIGLRAGRNVLLGVTGTFLASAADAVTVELVNAVSTQLV
jgi:hypothetical protein